MIKTKKTYPKKKKKEGRGIKIYIIYSYGILYDKPITLCDISSDSKVASRTIHLSLAHVSDCAHIGAPPMV
jgi:hypothetical protein